MEMKVDLPEKIYPSVIFDTDEKYLTFLNNIIKQTYMLSINESAAFYIGAGDMMKKKIFHDFLMETKRRFIVNKKRKKKS